MTTRFTKTELKAIKQEKRMKILFVVVLSLVGCLSMRAANALTCKPPPGISVACTVIGKTTYLPRKVDLTPAALLSATSVIHVWPAHAASNAAGVPTTGWDKPSIKANYVRNMNYNWTYTAAWLTKRETFENLSDVELGRMTMLYTMEGGNLQTLSDTIVRTLMTTAIPVQPVCGRKGCTISPAAIAYSTGVTPAKRLAAAIGEALVVSSVSRIKPTVLGIYTSHVAHPLVLRSVAHYQSLGLNPKAGFKSLGIPGVNLDFTIYELYLDFRTGALALSPESALLMTGLWTKFLLVGSFAAGYETGNDMLAAFDTISPGFSDWLASELGSGIQEQMQTVEIPDYVYSEGYQFVEAAGCGCEITVEWDDMTVIEPK
jgi:hypothetical protein